MPASVAAAVAIATGNIACRSSPGEASGSGNLSGTGYARRFNCQFLTALLDRRVSFRSDVCAA